MMIPRDLDGHDAPGAPCRNVALLAKVHQCLSFCTTSRAPLSGIATAIGLAPHLHAGDNVHASICVAGRSATAGTTLHVKTGKVVFGAAMQMSELELGCGILLPRDARY